MICIMIYAHIEIYKQSIRYYHKRDYIDCENVPPFFQIKRVIDMALSATHCHGGAIGYLGSTGAELDVWEEAGWLEGLACLKVESTETKL